MSEDLKNILSHLNPDIDQETLLRYLQGKLSAQEQHEVERQLMDSDFEADALDGLQDFKDKQKLTALVDQLNSDLKKRTEKKKRFRKKLKLTLDSNLIITAVIILLLLIITFFILHRLAVRP